MVSVLLGARVCAAAAADEPAGEPEPPPAAASAASAPAAAASAPTLPADTTAPETPPAPGPLGDLPQRIETTLDSWQEFLDQLLIDALGPNPERRYRVFGQRKTVDLGKRWTLALDERQTGLLNSAGVGIPVAGQPARTWEVTHIGNINDLRFYNQRDGTGLENGGSIVTTLAPGWSLRTRGRRLHDDSVGVARTDAQTGLRAGSHELWVEGFVRHARLEDHFLRENWADPEPRANFGGVQAQWEARPGLTFNAQHQRAIKPEMAPGDERLAGPRTEFGADYRPGGAWSGSRVYWREATQLGLLSSPGVEERTTYKRVIGGEVPEGSPDGLIYAQIRQRSLIDDRDALLVLGWRHTMELAPKWNAQTLIESGIPIGGDNAVRSNTVDLRVQHNDFPHHAFSTEWQAVRTPIKNSAFAGADFTKRLSRSTLFVTRASATVIKPYDRPDDVPVNSGEASVGLGWLEPEARRFSTFWRYSFVAREALRDGVTTPEVADRRARIVFGEVDWQHSEHLDLLLHASRRWDRDDSFNGGQPHTTNLVMLRPTQQIARRWRMSVHYARRTDTAQPTQNGYGFELSVQMNHKIVLALGYNFRGIDDGELAGDDRLGKGVQARLYIPVEAALKHWLRPSTAELERN
ncbi:MAG: hypothetical protein KF891_19480 [Rhizobacter sp.]|nr:hypothetical protein [Rhizobacter sp.]